MRAKLLAAFAVLAVSVAVTTAQDNGLTKGTPEVKSISALAFGPNGLLFVGDQQGATIFAVGTGDTKPAGDKAVNVERIDAKLAGLLGVTDKDVTIADVKVNPTSGNIFIAANRGKSGGPALLKLTRGGDVEAVSMKDIPFSKVSLGNVTDKQRSQAITSMAFLNGKLYVAGLSNEEFASTLRAIPFPFQAADKGTGIEIFHGAHGKLETNAPIRTFTPYKVGKEDAIMAAYTCTPLVKIPVSELKDGAKVKGTTIAELGNRNQPIDMIPYTKDGKPYILMANSARGVMKIPADGFEMASAITARPATDTAGVKYETIAELKDVTQLDKLDDGRALILIEEFTGQGPTRQRVKAELKTIPLP